MQQPQNNFSYSISILSNIYKPGHNLSFDTFIREIVDFSRELIDVIVNNLLLELEQRHVPLRHLLNAKLIIYVLKDLPSKKQYTIGPLKVPLTPDQISCTLYGHLAEILTFQQILLWEKQGDGNFIIYNRYLYIYSTFQFFYCLK